MKLAKHTELVFEPLKIKNKITSINRRKYILTIYFVY